MKLNSSHVEFVLDCMRENTTKIRNIKQYLKAVLFNAPSTIDSYYTCLLYTSLSHQTFMTDIYLLQHGEVDCILDLYDWTVDGIYNIFTHIITSIIRFRMQFIL